MHISTIDKFGRESGINKKIKLIKGPQGNGFKLSKTGDFNIENKRLCNVGEPVNKTDVATRNYVDNQIEISSKILEGNIKESLEVLDINVRLTMDEFMAKIMDRVEKYISEQNLKMDKTIEKTKKFETVILRHLQRNQSPLP